MAFLADCYREHAASAIAANTMVRSAVGVGFPLVRPKKPNTED